MLLRQYCAAVDETLRRPYDVTHDPLQLLELQHVLAAARGGDEAVRGFAEEATVKEQRRVLDELGVAEIRLEHDVGFLLNRLRQREDDVDGLEATALPLRGRHRGNT